MAICEEFQTADTSDEDELTPDVLEIITVFSGSRSHKNKTLIARVKEAAHDDEDKATADPTTE